MELEKTCTQKLAKLLRPLRKELDGGYLMISDFHLRLVVYARERNIAVTMKAPVCVSYVSPLRVPVEALDSVIQSGVLDYDLYNGAFTINGFDCSLDGRKFLPLTYDIFSKPALELPLQSFVFAMTDLYQLGFRQAAFNWIANELHVGAAEGDKCYYNLYHNHHFYAEGVVTVLPVCKVVSKPEMLVMREICEESWVVSWVVLRYGEASLWLRVNPLYSNPAINAEKDFTGFLGVYVSPKLVLQALKQHRGAQVQVSVLDDQLWVGNTAVAADVYSPMPFITTVNKETLRKAVSLFEDCQSVKFKMRFIGDDLDDGWYIYESPDLALVGVAIAGNEFHLEVDV